MELKVTQIKFEAEEVNKNSDAYGKLLQAGCCLGGVSIGCAIMDDEEEGSTFTK